MTCRYKQILWSPVVAHDRACDFRQGIRRLAPACNDLRPRLGLTVTTLNVGVIGEHLTSQQAAEHAAGLAGDQAGLARVANIGRAQYSNPGPITPALCSADRRSGPGRGGLGIVPIRPAGVALARLRRIRPGEVSGGCSETPGGRWSRGAVRAVMISQAYRSAAGGWRIAGTVWPWTWTGPVPVVPQYQGPGR